MSSGESSTHDRRYQGVALQFVEHEAVRQVLSQTSDSVAGPGRQCRKGRDAALTDAVGVALALGEKEHGTRCDREPSGRLEALPHLGVRQFMRQFSGAADSALLTGTATCAPKRERDESATPRLPLVQRGSLARPGQHSSLHPKASVQQPTRGVDFVPQSVVVFAPQTLTREGSDERDERHRPVRVV